MSRFEGRPVGKRYTPEELQEILRLHALWLDRKEGGRCADMQGADLRGFSLSYTNLSHVDFGGSDLRGVDFSFSILSFANLRGTNLTDVEVTGAILPSSLLFSDIGRKLHSMSNIGIGLSPQTKSPIVLPDFPDTLHASVRIALAEILNGPHKQRADFRRHLRVLCHFAKEKTFRATGGGDGKGPRRDLVDLAIRLGVDSLIEPDLDPVTNKPRFHANKQQCYRLNAIGSLIVEWLGQHPKLLAAPSSAE